MEPTGAEGGMAALASAMEEMEAARAVFEEKAAVVARELARLGGTEPNRQGGGAASHRRRGPEPQKKPRKKAKQKAPKSTAASKKIEEISAPGLNPKKGDMKPFSMPTSALVPR